MSAGRTPARDAPAGVSIRLAQPADLAALPGLAARSFRDAYAATDDEADIAEYVALHFTPERFAAILADPDSRLFVASIEGAPVGYAHLARTPPPACVSGPDPIELVRLYLVGSATGRGVGSALMDAVVGEALRQERRTLWLGVYARNERAQRFYRGYGLEVVGTKAFRFGGKDCLDLVMAGRLPAASRASDASPEVRER